VSSASQGTPPKGRPYSPEGHPRTAAPCAHSRHLARTFAVGPRNATAIDQRWRLRGRRLPKAESEDEGRRDVGLFRSRSRLGDLGGKLGRRRCQQASQEADQGKLVAPLLEEGHSRSKHNGLNFLADGSEAVGARSRDPALIEREVSARGALGNRHAARLSLVMLFATDSAFCVRRPLHFAGGFFLRTEEKFPVSEIPHFQPPDRDDLGLVGYGGARTADRLSRLA
jgi:hypothetical protein